MPEVADTIAEPPAGSVAPLTAEQVNEITEATAHLMSLPLPEKLRERISGVLNDCVNETDAGDSSSNPNLLRVWLPRFIREQENN